MQLFVYFPHLFEVLFIFPGRTSWRIEGLDAVLVSYVGVIALEHDATHRSRLGYWLHLKWKFEFPTNCSINRWLMEIKHRRDFNLSAPFGPERYVFIVNAHFWEHVFSRWLRNNVPRLEQLPAIYYFVRYTDVKFPAKRRSKKKNNNDKKKQLI